MTSHPRLVSEFRASERSFLNKKGRWLLRKNSLNLPKDAQKKVENISSLCSDVTAGLG